MVTVNGTGVNGTYFNKELFLNEPMIEIIEFCALDRIEMAMGHFEKLLDYAFFSSVTGAMRFGYGNVQLIIAVAFKIIGKIGLTFSSNENKDYWEKFINRANYHVFNGLLNMGKGFLEFIPLVNWVFFKHAFERDKLIMDVREGKEGLMSIKLMSGKYVEFNRTFYEGELKRMHQVVQEKAIQTQAKTNLKIENKKNDTENNNEDNLKYQNDRFIELPAVC